MEYQRGMFMKPCAAEQMVYCNLHWLALFLGMWHLF